MALGRLLCNQGVAGSTPAAGTITLIFLAFYAPYFRGVFFVNIFVNNLDPERGQSTAQRKAAPSIRKVGLSFQNVRLPHESGRPL